jgi:alkylation response protein AidB-like acyl-CoA dehydrogenase
VIRVLATELATGARDVFADLVQSHAGAGTSEGFFARDHRSIWRDIVAGGWHCVGLSEARGGSGFDLLDLSVFAELWGRSLIPLPYLPTVLLLRWSGVTADDAPASILTYSLPPRAGDPSASGISPFYDTPGTAAAIRVGDGSIETEGRVGSAAPAPAPHDAAGTPSMPLRRVGFATEGLPARAQHEVAVLGAAELVGAAAAVLEKSVSYARQREQFGRPIAEYQAVQHRLADMLCDLEVGRSAIVKAANDPDDFIGAVAVAWERARRVTENGIRIHGGFGMTWDAGLHHYTRHVMAWGELLESCGVDLWHL